MICTTSSIMDEMNGTDDDDTYKASHRLLFMFALGHHKNTANPSSCRSLGRWEAAAKKTYHINHISRWLDDSSLMM